MSFQVCILHYIFRSRSCQNQDDRQTPSRKWISIVVYLTFTVPKTDLVDEHFMVIRDLMRFL